MEIDETLKRVHQCLKESLKDNTDEIGVDIGLKLVNENGRFSVDQEHKDVWVRLFKFQSNGRRKAKITLEEESVKNTPVQIVNMVGRVSPNLSRETRMAREKYRGPLLGGIPVNGSNRGSNSNFGTVGAIVYDKKDDLFKNHFILSCHHVLCDANNPTTVPGPEVFHPPFGKKVNDGKDFEKFWVGKLVRSGIGEDLDCAVAEINEGVKVENKILQLGTVKGIRTPRLGRVVRKSGAVTGVTWGLIDGVHGTWKMDSEGTEVYSNLIHISPLGRIDGEVPEISHYGDSGSLWVTEANDAIALLIAGEMGGPLEYALGHPIHDVLETLNINFKL